MFALAWEDFTRLPSRKSAEPVNQAERARLLAEVSRQGHIRDYQGVRISSTGRRFRVRRALVWNILDKRGEVVGQAAAFSEWDPLPDPYHGL